MNRPATGEVKERTLPPCRICGSREVAAVGQLVNMPAEALYCRVCDSFSPSLFPSDEELSGYYQNFGFNPPPSRPSSLRRQLREFSRKCSRIGARIQRTGGTLLDFGGGCGMYARGFAAAGFDVTMTEVDHSALETARKLGVRALVIEKVQGPFDVVFSSHVVEHCKDPDSFFAALARFTKPSGVAIVACPNKNAREFYRFEHVRGYLEVVSSSSLSGFIANPWWCLDPPRHFYSLSGKALAILAERHGFEVAETFSEFSTRSDFAHNDMYALCRLGNVLHPLGFLYKIYVNLCSLAMSIVFRHSMQGDNLVVILSKRRGEAGCHQ